MSFMKPDVYKTDYLEIDGPYGTEIVPCDIVDFNPIEIEHSNDRGGLVDRFPIPIELRDYCENRTAWTIERKHGWIGRYSAPGYMDCTSWNSGESEAKVYAELERLYGEDDQEND